MEVVELRGADTDVQPILGPSRVSVLTCGAQILQISTAILNPLEDPELPGVVVDVVHRHLAVWDGLSVGAEVPHWPAGHRHDDLGGSQMNKDH